MRISDWSSDVCSSDLRGRRGRAEGGVLARALGKNGVHGLPDRPDRERLPHGGRRQGSVGNDSGGGTVMSRRHIISLLMENEAERKSVVKGKSVSVRVDLGGRRSIKKKQKNNIT